MSCRGEYVSKNCECLPDPMDPYNYVCGYVNKQNGLVYPCDPGCCEGKCNQTVSGVRFKIDPSQYSDNLPEGFNVNLPQSNSSSLPPGAADIPPLPTVNAVSVLEVVLFAVAILVAILMVSFVA